MFSKSWSVATLTVLHSFLFAQSGDEVLPQKHQEIGCIQKRRQSGCGVRPTIAIGEQRDSDFYT